MAGPIERGGVAAEEIPRHEHLQRTFFSLRGRFDTLHRPFLHDVEVFGRVTFSKNELALPVMGFGQFIEQALAIGSGEDLQQGNAIQSVGRDCAGPFI
jgi:hypothetical protein